eukprot:TRINITY_DN8271_c0_g1_i1.p1 TRINITY_DN8271_c0_g1~~TRINITY_DN8271_c0_g1_i1.p1  ORF type:complete len:308 (+),score=96.98 TRINITY_DN8271_c0_g1_i1:76-924(+)
MPAGARLAALRRHLSTWAPGVVPVAAQSQPAALVTGAGSGIGRAAALSFAAAGYRVLCADVNGSAAAATAATARSSHGVAAVGLAADVADEAQVERMVQAAVSEFGRLDACFNNAGIEGARAPTDQYPTEQFDRVLAVNLRGIFLCMKHELRIMRKQEPRGARSLRGTIINTSSTAGLKGMAEFGAYCSSKWAILGLTRTAAKEFAPAGIRVCAVCPATTDTAMVARFASQWPEWQRMTNASYDIGRVCTPEEVAEAVVWLASDKCAFLTGDPLILGGGSTC